MTPGPVAPFSDAEHRTRQDPRPGDLNYIHLSDLALALRPRLERARGAWLDFGAGTSPYAAYAPKAEMKRADFPGVGEPPDFVLEPGESCPAPDQSFDGVLSTQVLEHVPDAGAYLRDALRMLRPGGELLLTTHGIWEDHPSPLDIGRWTLDGLRREVAAAGFEVTEAVPLTCGVRAVLLLMNHELQGERWWSRYRSPTGLPLGLLRLLGRYRGAWVDRFADRALAERRVGAEGEDTLYLAVLIVARRPA